MIAKICASVVTLFFFFFHTLSSHALVFILLFLGPRDESRGPSLEKKFPSHNSHSLHTHGTPSWMAELKSSIAESANLVLK